MKMDVRQKCIVGDWKMHKTADEARQLATGIADVLVSKDRAIAILCPPFPNLHS